MAKSYRQIRVFVSHPFEPKNSTYSVEDFRSSIQRIVDTAAGTVKDEYKDLDVKTTFTFSDWFSKLPTQIEQDIRKCHVGLVDITEKKPNIFFEYGLIYGLDTPSILMKATSSLVDFPIPADLKDRLILTYADLADLEKQCIEQLTTCFRKLIEEDELGDAHLNRIWFPPDIKSVHVITSTESRSRQEFADPESENFMHLESLGDKDTLVWVIAFLSRTYRRVHAQMYAADVFRGAIEENLVIIGGPGEGDGDGNVMCKTMMEKISAKVSYNEDCDKLIHDGVEYMATRVGNRTTKDYGYFARFPNPHNPRNSVILINGIHTLGVLGAAKAFSDHALAQKNIRKVLNKLQVDDVRQASFECFFEVEILQMEVVCPDVKEEWILPIERK